MQTHLLTMLRLPVIRHPLAHGSFLCIHKKRNVEFTPMLTNSLGIPEVLFPFRNATQSPTTTCRYKKNKIKSKRTLSSSHTSLNTLEVQRPDVGPSIFRCGGPEGLRFISCVFAIAPRQQQRDSNKMNLIDIPWRLQN